MKYISLGTQCITPELFAKLGIKTESLPFDWILSTPEFVYTILHKLLIDNISPDVIVHEDFFNCDKRSSCNRAEHYFTIPTGSGGALLNSKYNVVFPHDAPNEHEKYIRRMERLKNIILDLSESICFVYVSTSSEKGAGAYTVDGEYIIKNIPYWIEKINQLINTIRSNYVIWVLTTARDECDRVISERVNYINMPEYPGWSMMLPCTVGKFAPIVASLR